MILALLKFRRTHAITWCACICIALADTTRAGVAPVGEVDTAIAPFVDQTTDVVIAFDLQQIDIDPIEAWLKAQIEAASIEKEPADRLLLKVKQPVERRQSLAEFRRAGGRRLYLVGHAARPDSFVAIAPLQDGVEADAILKSLDRLTASAKDFEMIAPMLSDTRVTALIGKHAVIGTKQAIEAAKKCQPVARLDLMQALAAGGNAAFRAAFSPAALQRLPGATTQPATRQLRWILLAIRAPPQEFLVLTIQSSDPAAAQQAATAFKELLAQVNPAKEPELSGVLNALAPQVQGTRVVARLDTRMIESTLTPALINRAVRSAAEPGRPDNGKE